MVERWFRQNLVALFDWKSNLENKKMNTESTTSVIQATGEAMGFIPAGQNGKPITVIGTALIRDAFDAKCIEQAPKPAPRPGCDGTRPQSRRPRRLRRARRPARVGFADSRVSYPVGVDIKCSSNT